MTFMDSDLEAPPKRSVLVVAAAVTLTALSVVLLLVVLVHVWHALAMGSDINRAANVTDLEPTTILRIGLYEHDLLPIVVGLIVLGLFARLVPKLARGSSSARTSTVVVSLVLALGCLGIDRVWGSSAVVREIWIGGTASATYMAQFIAAQRADMPGWTDGLLTFAVVAIPLLALVNAALLLAPPASEYFAAMRRSGSY